MKPLKAAGLISEQYPGLAFSTKPTPTYATILPIVNWIQSLAVSSTGLLAKGSERKLYNLTYDCYHLCHTGDVDCDLEAPTFADRLESGTSDEATDKDYVSVFSVRSNMCCVGR